MMDTITDRCLKVWLIVCVLYGVGNFYMKHDNQPSPASLADLYEHNLQIKRNVIENIKLGQSTSIRPDNINLKDREQAISAIEQDIIELGGLYRDDLNNLPKKQIDYLLDICLESFVKSVGLLILGFMIGWLCILLRPKKTIL